MTDVEPSLAEALERSPFGRLEPDVRLALARLARQLRIDDGDYLFREGDAGDAAYVVTSGAIEIVGRLLDGQEVARARLETGALFGELALFAGGRRAASARAVGRTTVAAIDFDSLRNVLRTWPDAAFGLLRHLTEKFLELEHAHRAAIDSIPDAPTPPRLGPR